MSPRNAPSLPPSRLVWPEDDGDVAPDVHPDADYPLIPVITISSSSEDEGDQEAEGNQGDLRILEPEIVIEQVQPIYSCICS